LARATAPSMPCTTCTPHQGLSHTGIIVAGIGQEPEPGGRGGAAGPQPSRIDRRRYFVLMSICIGLFILSWAVVDRYSVLAAIIISIVALAIPPFAAIIANVSSATDRRRQ
jgi:hypothetical protein